VQSDRSHGEHNARDNPDDDEQNCDPNERMIHAVESRERGRLRLYRVVECAERHADLAGDSVDRRILRGEKICRAAEQA
jgi:hypothetical protein